MKRIYLIFILFQLKCFCFAQNKTIDSLRMVLKTHKEDTNKVKTLKNLCWRYGDVGDYEKAISYANEGIELGQKLNFKKGISNCYNEIGIIYKNQSNYSKALEYYTKSLKINEELGYKKGISSSYYNIGLIYWQQYNYIEGLKAYFAALKIREEIGDKKGIADCYTNIGIIYENQTYYQEALKNHFDALKIREEIGDKRGIAGSYNNIGNNYDYLSNYNAALKNHFACLKIYEDIGDKQGIARSNNNIAIIYDKQGNYEQAKKNYLASLKIKEAIDDKLGIAETYLNLGKMNLKMQNSNEGKDWLIKALTLAQEIRAKDKLKDIYQGLAMTDSALGNYKGAYQNHKLFILYSDSLINEDNTRKITQQQMQYEFEKKEINTKTAFEKRQDSLRLEQQKQIALQQLRFTYEQKQVQAKTKQEQQNLLYEEEIKRQNIENEFNQLQSKKQATQDKKDALVLEESKKQKIVRNSFIGGFVLMFLLSVVTYNNYRRKQRDNKIIGTQKLLVEMKNKEILSSIEYAKRIQATILPPPKVVKKYLDDSFVLYLPKDIVAGDFYWMDSIENINNKKETILFAACDCTGHGVPGALVSVVCSNALNRVVKEYNITQPSLILDKVAELVVKDFSKDENENVQDGMDASLCALNIETGELQWAGANNPLWIIRNGELLETKADKQPIGKMDNRKPFINHEMELQKGDTIYLFTDGYADQFGGSNNKKYSKKAFRELVVTINNLTLIEQREALYNAHILWRGENEQVDDICVIGVRI